jgi:hypothetical protein
MIEDQDRKEIRSKLFLALFAVSLMLFAGSIYLVKTFAIFWGSGVGSALQATADKTQPIQAIQPITTNLGLFHIAIVISYVLSVVSLVLTSSSLILYLRREEDDPNTTRTYGLVHSVLTVFYALILLVLLTELSAYLQTYDLYIIYLGILLGLAVDAYIQYDIRTTATAQSGNLSSAEHDISMDPATPYTNMLNLQHELFSRMAGHLRVVDKHFNTSSLENFHRLLDKHIANFTKITILTSKEMLDTNFSVSVTEFNKELESEGVTTEVRIMDAKDSAEQHERFIMDENTAYKIPPFNIINKKSEHITKIKLSDARSRFYYLYGRGSKIDNYLVRKGHDEQKHE